MLKVPDLMMESYQSGVEKMHEISPRRPESTRMNASEMVLPYGDDNRNTKHNKAYLAANSF